MLIYIFWVLGKYKPYGILVEPVTQTSCWKTILLHRSGNLSVDLKSCCFDRLNLVSVIGTSDIIKWPGKISFQSNLTLEQQLLLLHLTFLEFQKNEVSHRKRINVCNNFCVWMCTHVSFQPPIPNLGNCIRHFRNCSLVFLDLSLYLQTSWMDGYKAKNNSINRYQMRPRWKVVGKNIEI